MHFCWKSELQVPVTQELGRLSNYEQTKSHLIRQRCSGSTENARHETKAQAKCRGGNYDKRKLRHTDAGIKNAKNRNCGTILKGWKCGTFLLWTDKRTLSATLVNLSVIFVLTLTKSTVIGTMPNNQNHI